MDEIQSRLQETSQNCLKAHAAWAVNKKDSKVQESLSAAIHELRKVCSRLEIDLAISERDQMTSRPLPIPAHRASKGKIADAGMDDMDEDFGNGGNGQHGGQQSGHSQMGARRRRPGGPNTLRVSSSQSQSPAPQAEPSAQPQGDSE